MDDPDEIAAFAKQFNLDLQSTIDAFAVLNDPDFDSGQFWINLATGGRAVEDDEPVFLERHSAPLPPGTGIDYLAIAHRHLDGEDGDEPGMGELWMDLAERSPRVIEVPLQPKSSLVLLPKLVEIHEAEKFTDLIRMLAVEPERVRELSPRGFEELTAEVLHRMGHEVELTPAQKDGGYDIAMRVDSGVTKHLVLVECKHHNSPIQVRLVEHLFGIVAFRNASSGMMVASTRFTRGAKVFAEHNPYRIELADFERMRDWFRICHEGLR